MDRIYGPALIAIALGITVLTTILLLRPPQPIVGTVVDISWTCRARLPEGADAGAPIPDKRCGDSGSVADLRMIFRLSEANVRYTCKITPEEDFDVGLSYRFDVFRRCQCLNCVSIGP